MGREVVVNTCSSGVSGLNPQLRRNFQFFAAGTAGRAGDCPDYAGGADFRLVGRREEARRTGTREAGDPTEVDFLGRGAEGIANMAAIARVRSNLQQTRKGRGTEVPRHHWNCAGSETYVQSSSPSDADSSETDPSRAAVPEAPVVSPAEFSVWAERSYLTPVYSRCF